MGERIIITGAQGFIGRYVVARWLAEDPACEIVGVGRSPRRPGHFTHEVVWGGVPLRAPLPPALAETLASDRYRYLPLDVNDRPALTSLLQEFRPTIVMHMAGSLRDDAADQLIRNNVGGAVALLEAIAGAAIERPRVVLGSTGGVYGDPDGQLPISEGRLCAPLDLYSASKRAAEDIARILARTHEIPVCWARIFNPVGPGQDERHFCGWVARNAAAIRAGIKEPVIEVGPTDTTRDFVDVRDVARGIVLIGQRGEPGLAYNVASGVETPVQLVLDEILRIAGLTETVRIDRRPGRPADIPRHYGDISRLRALGFERAHTITRSLEDVLAYYDEVVRPEARRVAGNGEREVADLPEQLDVQGRDHFHYPVLVRPGLIDEVPRLLAAAFPGARLVVLTDTTVRELHGERLLAPLKAMAGAEKVGEVVIPAGEPSKALEVHRRIIEEMHRLRFDRRAVLVCYGGGLVTDVGGFVAASYLRGVAYVNVPTTLIGQNDAAIGGKVAVNMPWAKNFVGAFHHPRAVYADPLLLATLDDRNLASGVAEAIKVAICGEPALFNLLEKEVRKIRFDRDPELLGELVKRAAAKKIALLDPDPYEVDLRRVLNLGHTFGHPLETQLAHAGILHGEAVGFGLAVATAIANARGLCPTDDAERIYRLLDAYGLPPKVERATLEACCAHMAAVRLVRANRLNFVFPTSVASTVIVDEVADQEFRDAIAAIAAHPVLGDRVVDGG